MSAAATHTLNCPSCGVTLPAALTEMASLAECPACARKMRVYAFPALHRPQAAAVTAPRAVLDGEATCFYHPQKRAQVPCDNCGRFLCAMCDLDVLDAHLCPQCLESGAEKGRLKSLERTRTRYDQIASALLIAPLVFCWFLVPLTSLAVLGLVGWKWKSPGSLVDNSRLRLTVCSVIAVLELIGSSIMWWLTMSPKNRF